MSQPARRARLLADHNFDEPTLRTLARRLPRLDMMRVREGGLARAPDPRTIEWAADQGRVLLPHDRETMPGHAYERVRAGLPTPSVVEVPEMAIVRSIGPS